MCRVLILLAVGLALANGQCFARCLAQPMDNGKASMPCHSHGKTSHGQTTSADQQHELQVTRVNLPAPAAFVALASGIAQGIATQTTSELFYAVMNSSPPPLDPATPLSLRI